MPRIFCIGPDILSKKDEGFLASKGWRIIKFSSINNLAHRPEDSPDVMIIDKNQSSGPSFREFQGRYREVPKIVAGLSGGHKL